MRVLDSGLELRPALSALMPRNKRKLKKSKYSDACPSDSSDSAATLRHQAGPVCPHIPKAVNLAAIRKNIRRAIGACQTCNAATPGGGSGGEELHLEADEDGAATTTVWLCLQCGNQGCGRTSRGQHALEHYNTPHSVSHSLVIHTTAWAVWCYDCDTEVAPSSSRKLLECIEFVRKRAGVGKTEAPPGGDRPGGRENDVAMATTHNKPAAATATTEIAADAASAAGKGKSRPSQSLSKVKGLCNLGNTCFFNAVIQVGTWRHLAGEMYAI
ncbi:PREDICTED: ubiquitin carboxyl-terminal hydrolase 16-like [Priapulus caudatus]|uniref:Ubiquitin carboxyl-terminal hydrolase 16-like n=1 Tax=Priapulus caudatus TaxID=37621 RepID=A0ABM1EWH8_PRICU|nr:PREDICTED: ubiquitin carboxyl-terminal hydrolase 16-like [Priapulus caudatus]